MSFCLKALFAFSAIMLLVHPAPVLAQGGGGPAGIPLIEYMFARVVCVAVPLGYIALLVVLVIAGIKYLTSGGEAKAVQQAHQTVTWGLLGMLFLALAWLILLLIQNFTGVEVTKFNVASLPGVQGFSGQCLGPAPLAPETPKTSIATQPTSPTPTSTSQRKFILTVPPARQCTDVTRSDIPMKLCKIKLPCVAKDFISIDPKSISNLVIYTDGNSIEDLQDAFSSPQFIHILPLDEVESDTLYKVGRGIEVLKVNATLQPSGLALNEEDKKTLLDGIDEFYKKLGYYEFPDVEGGYYAKFKRDTIPEEFLRFRIKALDVYLAKDGITLTAAEFAKRSGGVTIDGYSCLDGDYYKIRYLSPLIYAYPQKQMSIILKVYSPLVSRINLTADKSWVVSASTDGTLATLDGKKHKFISYEFLRNDFRRPEKGFVIEDNKLEAYLKNDLWKKLGLTDSEINDYWQDTKPRVKPSPYYFVSLIDRSEIDRVLPMEVNPKPDTILRNMTYILPLSQAPVMSIMPLEEEKLTAPKRDGFTVLENGVFTDGF